jgi:hypothetical protein
LEETAQAGNEFAMFHLGRWYRLGYGVKIDLEKAFEWYRNGAQTGSSRCLVNVARCTVQDDVKAAISMFEDAAVRLGDISAHCFWADHDKENYDRSSTRPRSKD